MDLYIPPQYGPFTPAGSGAVARTIQSKLRDVVSVKDFGAVGDNSNDDTAEIQACIDAVNAAGGGTVYFPAGTYKISSALTVPTNGKVVLLGSGLSSTVLRQTGAAADGVVFASNASTTGGGVCNLSIEAGAGYQTSGFQGTGSTGTGLSVTDWNDGFVVYNVGVYGFTNGAKLLGCWNGEYRNLNILYCAGEGLLIDKSGVGAGGGNNFSAIKVSNNGFTGTNTSSIGVRVRASGGEEMAGIDVTGFNKAWVIDPRASEQVAYLFGWALLGDTSTDDGWTFDASAGKIIGCRFENLWSGFNGGNGVVVLGALAENIRATGRIRENAEHGLLLQGGGFSWEGGSINNNSRGNSNTYDGVNVAANVSLWNVLDTFLGNDASASVSHQRYGIVIAAGTSDRYQVLGCLFDGNLTAAASDGSTGSNVAWGPNLPANSATLNRFPGRLTVGLNDAITHRISQANDTRVLIYSDAANQVAIEFVQASNEGVKYDVFFNKYGGSALFGGNITGTNAIKSTSPTAGVGYATGAGGTVTQVTDKGTGVTLSKVCGQITTHDATLNADTTVSFTLTNTAIAATDVLVLNHVSGGTVGAYTLNAQCAAGSATINIRNVTAGNLGEALVISFVLVKGVTA